MLIGAGTTKTPAGPGGLVKDSDTAHFAADVLDASRQVPVIVDFWAPWCGPCKQLGPVLERAVNAARGAVRLVKINIDENQDLAREMRIQSIPAVYAFVGGRPVDGFMGALPESQVKAFVGRLAGGAGPSPIDEMLEAAKAALDEGDLGGAAQAYAAVLQEEATNPKALAGLARCYVANGDAERARQTLALVPPEGANDPDVIGALAALDLASAAPATDDIEPLRAKVAAEPGDPQARYDLAMALIAGRREEEAIATLLEIVRRHRQWNEEAGRKQLVKLFEALGPKDPRTLAGRRALSSILFS